MTTLVLSHNGWDVVTEAWSAAAIPGNKVQVCYQWGANRVSTFSGATGISRRTLDILMPAFLDAISSGGVVDCRAWCQ